METKSKKDFYQLIKKQNCIENDQDVINVKIEEFDKKHNAVKTNNDMIKTKVVKMEDIIKETQNSNIDQGNDIRAILGQIHLRDQAIRDCFEDLYTKIECIAANCQG